MSEQMQEETNLISENASPKPVSSQNPEDIAAHHFKEFLPMFERLVDKLSVRQTKRLVKSLVAYPLEDKNHIHRKGDEIEALKLGEALMQSKYIMFMTQLYKLSEEEMKKQSEQSSSEEKGDTNG